MKTAPIVIATLFVIAPNWENRVCSLLGDNQTVVIAHNEIVFSRKQKVTKILEPNNIDESQNNYIQWKKPDDSIYIKILKNATKMKSKLAVEVRGWWERLWRGTKKIIGVMEVFLILISWWYLCENWPDCIAGPLPGPKSGLWSNTWKWIVRGDTRTDKARDLLGRGTQAESSRVRSDSGFFLVVYPLLSQDGCHWELSLEVIRHMVFPFDLSWTLLVCGDLLVPCSLLGLGPLVIK